MFESPTVTHHCDPTGLSDPGDRPGWFALRPSRSGLQARASYRRAGRSCEQGRSRPAKEEAAATRVEADTAKHAPVDYWSRRLLIDYNVISEALEETKNGALRHLLPACPRFPGAGLIYLDRPPHQRRRSGEYQLRSTQHGARIKFRQSSEGAQRSVPSPVGSLMDVELSPVPPVQSRLFFYTLLYAQHKTSAFDTSTAPHTLLSWREFSRHQCSRTLEIAQST